MKIEFNNKAVFLTGASRGIGKRIKEIFEEAGARVISPSREELDLASEESIAFYLQSNANQNVDIFIHCAGINQLAGIDRIDQAILQNVFQVNMFSAVQILRACVENMKARKWGRVVFVSSLYSMVSKEERIAYSASKNALTGLMKTLTLELGKDNILVNAVAPGYVMTDMTKRNLSGDEICEIESQIPLGRFQSEDDIAYLIAFLCSELNHSITGQLIAVDGGFTCR